MFGPNRDCFEVLDKFLPLSSDKSDDNLTILPVSEM